MQRTVNRSKGLAAIEVVFSLPVILMCVGVGVYVGTVMKGRMELLGAVQDVTRVCAMGQVGVGATACVAAQSALVADRLERCDNLVMESQVQPFGENPYGDIPRGEKLRGVPLERATVSLEVLEVTGRCDVVVRFPLRFEEFGVFRFDVNEVAAMPLRLERVDLP
jgi:hypothetical protein